MSGITSIELGLHAKDEEEEREMGSRLKEEETLGFSFGYCSFVMRGNDEYFWRQGFYCGPMKKNDERRLLPMILGFCETKVRVLGNWEASMLFVA